MFSLMVVGQLKTKFKAVVLYEIVLIVPFDSWMPVCISLRLLVFSWFVRQREGRRKVVQSCSERAGCGEDWLEFCSDSSLSVYCSCGVVFCFRIYVPIYMPISSHISERRVVWWYLALSYLHCQYTPTEHSFCLRFLHDVIVLPYCCLCVVI